ncbi:OadG family transporter subunit [Gallalistipes aquisgranensis]|uniref:OadG family transporter subunit n=1 Tax=Gallalistipes aquisgranensis TaxID=2779358 RepID=UPI001CF89795|nr:OadG family transporter subunit [Gallalistipes aquisgranensis]MBE5034322.1 OadG family protein [Gallalistipes aquisgranensis]
MRRLFALGLMLMLGAGVSAQGIKDIRINEVMVRNVDNYEDDYGKRIGWIELFNTGYSKVNLAGAHLSVKLGDNRYTYRIPSGDPRTVVAPRDYVVFFCDGTDTKGTFHTNFTLDQTGYLALLDASGKGKPIDEIRYEVSEQEPDVSIGVLETDEGPVFGKLPRTTPGATNDVIDEVPKHEKFRRMDPSGIIMAITAMSVVFSALLILYILFSLLGKTMKKVTQKNQNAAGKVSEPLLNKVKGNTFSGEAEIAAIAMALHMYRSEMHDKESTVLTINRVARAYSPWSSKIYGLRQIPNKK